MAVRRILFTACMIITCKYVFAQFSEREIGFRVGFDGGPNGLTILIKNKFEIVAGYSNKDITATAGYDKGDIMTGTYFQYRFILFGKEDVSYYPSVGLRARAHLNRPHPPGLSFTFSPDFLVGFGFTINPNFSPIDIFADLHFLAEREHNEITYKFGFETGAGIRIRIYN